MKINQLNPGIIEAAKAYGFTVKEDKKLNIITVTNGTTFWWDTSYSEENFWQELKEYFHRFGSYNI